MNDSSKNHFDPERFRWMAAPRVTGAQALILIIVGFILIILPGTVLTTLIRIIGAAAVLSGVWLAYSWYRDRDAGDKSMLAFGAIAVLIGLFLITSPRTFVNIFPIAAGIVILINGLFHLAEALELRRSGSSRWLAAAVLSVITVVLGLLLLLNPFGAVSTLVRVLGIVMVYNGLTGLFISSQLR